MLLKIKGMGCMHCVAKVKKTMEELVATVKSCEIGACEIENAPDADRIKEAIESIGFELISIEA